MLILFAIVAFLSYQLGVSFLFFYLMDSRRHRKFIDGGFNSVF